MTKEEILYRLSRQVINGEYTIKCEKANEAMELYAKQQVIAFYRFVQAKFEPHGDNFVSKYPCDNTVYFIDELHDLFIEQSIK